MNTKKDTHAFIPVPPELVLEGCAHAAREFLVDSGLLAELADAKAVLAEVKLLKEGLLTAQQAADMLKISLRTFKRQVKAKMWPEIQIMGSQEFRYPLPGMIAAMERRRQRASGEPEHENAIELARRLMKAA